MFNNRIGNIKFLVATDAVGMGLNLNIQRVIFSTVEKSTRFGGKKLLDAHSVKQIGGRAGRYTQDGQVTAFAHSDLQHIRRSIGFKEKVNEDNQSSAQRKEPGKAVVIEMQEEESEDDESHEVAETLQQMLDRTRELKFDESDEEDEALIVVPDIESANGESKP